HYLMHECSARSELIDYLEHILYEPMCRLDITLPSVGAGRDGRVPKPLDRLHSLGELAIRLSLPVADELTAVVSLEACGFELHAARLQMLKDDLSKELRVGERAFLREGDVVPPARHLSGRVLVARQP